MGTLKKPTVAAVVLSWRRPANVPVVVEALRRQAAVSEVYVWHNRPSAAAVAGAVNVFCESNLKCRVRHAFAQALGADYVLFIDDDIYPSVDLSSHLHDAIARAGDKSVLGVFGVVAGPGAAGYSAGVHLHGHEEDRIGRNGRLVPELTAVDVVKGRLHLIRRDRLAAVWATTDSFPLSDRQKEEDDILLSAGSSLLSGHPNYVFPAPGLRELPAPHARFRAADHRTVRDSLVVALRRGGWRSIEGSAPGAGGLEEPLPQTGLPEPEVDARELLEGSLEADVVASQHEDVNPL